jgi:integrase
VTAAKAAQEAKRLWAEIASLRETLGELAAQRAGLEPASAHQLRHAAATAMRRAGAPLSEISQLLRHQHEGTTSRYGTIDPDELGPVTAPWPGKAS